MDAEAKMPEVFNPFTNKPQTLNNRSFYEDNKLSLLQQIDLYQNKKPYLTLDQIIGFTLKIGVRFATLHD